MSSSTRSCTDLVSWNWYDLIPFSTYSKHSQTWTYQPVRNILFPPELTQSINFLNLASFTIFWLRLNLFLVQVTPALVYEVKFSSLDSAHPKQVDVIEITSLA